MTDNSITVTAGSATVTGNLTQFVAAPGDLLTVNGLTVPIRSCNSTSSLTLLFPWPAATAANVTAWAILSLGPYWRSTVTVNQQITDLIAKLNAGLPLRVQATGTLANRAQYDTQPVGFVYLRTDVSPQQIFVRTTDTAGSWSAPIVLQITPAQSTAQAEAARDVAVAARDVSVSSKDAARSSELNASAYAGYASGSAGTAAASASAAQGYRDSAAGYAASINPANLLNRNTPDTIFDNLTIYRTDGAYWLHYPGVAKVCFTVTVDGRARFQDSDGNIRFSIGYAGDVNFKQIGDLDTRIELRGAAYADDRQRRFTPFLAQGGVESDLSTSSENRIDAYVTMPENATYLQVMAKANYSQTSGDRTTVRCKIVVYDNSNGHAYVTEGQVDPDTTLGAGYGAAAKTICFLTVNGCTPGRQYHVAVFHWKDNATGPVYPNFMQLQGLAY